MKLARICWKHSADNNNKDNKYNNNINKNPDDVDGPYYFFSQFL